MTINFAQQVVQRWLDRRILARTINARGKKAFQTKAAAHARCGPTFCADARFGLKIQRNRSAWRPHERTRSICPGSTVANSNSYRMSKSYSQPNDSRKTCRRRTEVRTAMDS